MTPEEWKAWRKRRSWTQKQAAQALGIHPDHVSKLERGDKKPSETLRLLAQCLDREGECTRSES
uniref:Putative DNA-binding transcriptional regulator n=1 Tax=Magnetococcus massalia (strain MO-1) TaxID=451514 RepID=A0A1S7LMB9_MAGMO